MDSTLSALLICSVLGTCAAAAGIIAYKKRRRPVEGVFLGLLTGPVGVVAEVLLPSVERPEVCEHAWNSFRSVVTYQDAPSPAARSAARD